MVNRNAIALVAADPAAINKRNSNKQAGKEPPTCTVGGFCIGKIESIIWQIY